MKREISYKAKGLHNQVWVFGDLFYYRGIGGFCTIRTISFKEDESIENIIETQIHPRTICQYTGINDKNGTKIFEGDLIKNSIATFYVDFHKGVFGCRLRGEECLADTPNLALRGMRNIEVVGNIHDKN